MCANGTKGDSTLVLTLVIILGYHRFDLMGNEAGTRQRWKTCSISCGC